ncbi:hypothetical protein BH09VER1_BH09VER1_20640 [soil metagenome]
MYVIYNGVPNSSDAKGKQFQLSLELFIYYKVNPAMAASRPKAVG